MLKMNDVNSDRWQQIKKVFTEAVEREPAQREAFLAEACVGDTDLRAEVEELLASYQTEFMAQPAVGAVANLIAGEKQDLKSGQRINQYEIVRPIGAGGMGVVYLAQDTKLRRQVALKLLPHELTDNRDRLRRFEQEARAASALNHPNILTIHEIGTSQGASFIATEFIDGETLRQRMNAERFSPTAILDLATQIVSALATAHEAGIVHRDIKPENIMLRRDGIVKVLDFGLAKTVATNASTAHDVPTIQLAHTDPGVVMGTVHYMSPEQARGQAVDGRTDTWSVGVVLYELVAGQKPFIGETASDVIAAILKTDPKPLKQIAPDTPDELQRIVLKTLRNDKEARYQTAKELLVDLRSLKQELEFSAKLARSVTSSVTSAANPSEIVPALSSAGLTQPASSHPTSSAEYIVTRLQHHRKGVVAALAVLLLAVTLLAYFFYFRRAPRSILTEQDTILLADFDNKTDDPIFDGTLKQGLAAQLQQSPFLNFLPDAQARQTLRLMNHSPDEHITREIGRDICQRQELKAMIAGTIAKLDRDYSLTLEAINCQSGATIALTQMQAEGKDQVLPTLSKAAVNLREKLGESLGSIKKFDVPIDQLTTGSLDALKAYSLAFDRSNKGKYFESVPLFKHATELDPNFAYAFALLAGNNIILTQPRHAAENAARAFALKERVSEREQLYINNYYNVASVGDLDKSVEALAVYKQTYPKDFRPPGNLSLTYSLLGQFDKAVVEARESVTLNPNISAWHVMLGTSLLRLNRFGDAKETFERAIQMGLDDPRLHAGLYQLAFIDHDTTRMQQQVDWASGKPEEYFAADLQSTAAAFLGQWRQANDLTRRAIDLATRVDVKEVAARFAADEALQAAFFGRCDQVKTFGSQSLALERNQVTLARVALSQAWCGDTGQAPSMIDELTSQHPRDTIVNGLWIPMIRAAMELSHGSAAKSVELLETTRAYEPVAELLSRYLRAQAYLKDNKPAEAEREYQEILNHRGEAPLSVLYPLAQLGLARVAAKTGDRTKARSGYEDFLALWKDADADLPLLQAAKSELKGLT
jgi:serine/threonine protein kinase/tetratricopeptide (TPR) repeat protein